MDITEETSEAKQRGQRLKLVRQLAGCDKQRDFCEKYPSLKLATIKAWESGKHFPLSNKGAKQIADLLKQDGIEVYPDWLLYGTPPGPQKLSSIHLDDQVSVKDLMSYRTRWVQERLSSWLTLNTNAVYHQIQGDSMMPTFANGDYVCALWLYGDDIKQVQGYPCLIETAPNQIICRTMQAASNHDEYSFLPMDYTSETEAVLHNHKPERVGYIFEIIPNLHKFINPITHD